MLENIRAKIDQNLKKFLTQVEQEYKLNQVNLPLYTHIREYCLRKGKRIRPLLVVLSYQGYMEPKKRTPSSLYYASTCIELLHLFMLIHDDIIDRSDLRRGKPTMHRLLSNIVQSNNPVLGQDLSIIAGDIVYAFAIDAFLSIKVKHAYKERALKYFVQTAAFTALGEFIDTLDGFKHIKEVKQKDVILNYSLKTARYTFDCPLVIGAMLAGADHHEVKKLSEIGLQVGQAFQIQDDIIGIFDTEKNIGKSLLSDIDEQKKTLLVTHAYENFSRTDKKKFMQTFLKKKKTMNDLHTMRKLFKKTRTLNYCLHEIQNRLEKADHIMSKIKMRSPQKKIIHCWFKEIFSPSQRIAKENEL